MKQFFSHFFYNNQLKKYTHKTIGPNKRTLNNQFLDGYKSCIDHTPTFTLVIGHKQIDEQLSQFCPCRSVFHCYHIQYPHQHYLTCFENLNGKLLFSRPTNLCLPSCFQYIKYKPHIFQGLLLQNSTQSHSFIQTNLTLIP